MKDEYRPLPQQAYPPARRHSIDEHEVLDMDEERKGLLADGELDYHDLEAEQDTPRWKRHRKLLGGVAVGLIVLILGAVFAPPLYASARSNPAIRPSDAFDRDRLRTNGTHLFKKTVVIISIDGLR